jgi:hypothetical protein
MFGEMMPPAASLLTCDIQPRGDLRVVQPISGQQNDSRSLRQPDRRTPTSTQSLQICPLLLIQFNDWCFPHALIRRWKSYINVGGLH